MKWNFTLAARVIDRAPEPVARIRLGEYHASYNLNTNMLRVTHQEDLFSYSVLLHQTRLVGLGFAIERPPTVAEEETRDASKDQASSNSVPLPEASAKSVVIKSAFENLRNSLRHKKAEVVFDLLEDQIVLKTGIGRLTSQLRVGQHLSTASVLYDGLVFACVEAAVPYRISWRVPGFSAQSIAGLVQLGVQHRIIGKIGLRAVASLPLNDIVITQTPNATPVAQQRSALQYSILLYRRVGDGVIGVVKSFGPGEKTGLYFGF